MTVYMGKIILKCDFCKISIFKFYVLNLIFKLETLNLIFFPCIFASGEE